MGADKKKCAIAFGCLMAEAREKKGLMQTEIAKILEISQAYYSQLETGMRIIDLYQARELCKILDIDLNEFSRTCQ